MSAPLSNKQKAYLAQLIRQAYRKVVGQPGPDVASEEDWRHQQVAAACGKVGLKCCDQYDYKRVEAHFLELLGNHGGAMRAHVQAETEPRRQAEAVLVRECERFGVRLAYAVAICQRQFRCGLFDATEKQIWNLVFTVRNRGNKRKREMDRETRETARTL
jgi:hypothetical protein